MKAAQITGRNQSRTSFETYLASRGLKADPWDRRILYDVFDYYVDAYRPKSSDRKKGKVTCCRFGVFTR